MTQTTDGKLRYTPDQDFAGQETLSYTVSDPWGKTAAAQVTVTVSPVNDAPLAFHDAHTFYSVVYSGSSLTFDVSWVRINDKDYDGDTLSFHSYGSASVGSLSLNNGILLLTVPENTYGLVTFQHTVWDGNAASNSATGNVFIIAPNTPWSGSFSAMADDYAVGEEQMESTPGVLANDTGAVLGVLVSHPTTGRMNSFGLNGVFTYTPDYQVVDNSFTYKIFNSVGMTAAASVNLYRPRMEIYHGQSAQNPVPEKIDSTIGAFTVANLNDTDADGIIDKDDNLVHPIDVSPLPPHLPILWPGNPEVDLMKVVVAKPNDPNPGTNKLTLNLIGTDAKLWTSPFKVEEVTQREFGLNELPKTVWLEVRAPSQNVGDVGLIAKYREKTYRVNGTGVWATQAGAAHDRTAAADLFALVAWQDIQNPPKGAIERHGGVGLRPIQPATIGVRNVILIKFAVTPSGIGRQPAVALDITRQIENKTWKQSGVGQPVGMDPWKTLPLGDTANDDGNIMDESAKPTPSGYFYSMDSPGWPSNQAFADLYVSRFNFFEYVRVRFDGVRPTGNTLSGSRASDKFAWHARHRLVKSDNLWVRSPPGDDPETEDNDIAPGHIALGTGP